MVTSALSDNRNFINIELNGRTYWALLNPGATLSLAGARKVDRLKGRLRESLTQVRAVTGNVSQALGNLPNIIEIDAKSKKMNFRAVAELDQKVILEIDFCKLFNIDVRHGRGLWCVKYLVEKILANQKSIKTGRLRTASI